jgi:hypothetical protein
MATLPHTVVLELDTSKVRKLVAEVRREVRKRNAAAKRALRLIDRFAWSAVTVDNPKARKELQRRLDICRAALEDL